jgi:hypothetical protein
MVLCFARESSRPFLALLEIGARQNAGSASSESNSIGVRHREN